MKNFFFAALHACAGILLLSGCVSEREMPADIGIKALEKRMMEAMDPVGSFAKARSYLQRQSIREERFWDPEYSEVVIKYKAPNRFRMEQYRENTLESVLILNSSSAWYVDMKKKEVTPLTEDRYEDVRTAFYLGKADAAYHDLFAKVDLSMVTDDEGTFYKLHCVPKRRDDLSGEDCSIDFYVGRDNFLIRKMRTNAGGRLCVTTVENYELYENVMQPVSTVLCDGESSTSRTVEYHLNIPIPDSEFIPPLFDGR